MIPLDKITHALAGAVIALALGYLLPPLVGICAAVIAGVFKEAYDSLHPDTHTVDTWDIVATTAGGVIGGLFVYSIARFS